MNETKDKIDLFNESNKPFSIMFYDEARYGKYELGVQLNFLKGEYENYCRNAFKKYAEKAGEPVKEDGLYTHGNGHEWKYVFCYYFEKEEGLAKINFDCEAGGFHCSSDDLDLLIDFGQRFRELCENEEAFEHLVTDALTAKEIEEKNINQGTMSMEGM